MTPVLLTVITLAVAGVRDDVLADTVVVPLNGVVSVAAVVVGALIGALFARPAHHQPL